MMLVAIAGLLHEEQRRRIEFLEEQIRVLMEVNGDRRLRLNDDQRRRLAVKGKRLGRGRAARTRDDRDAGHDSSVAPGTDRSEV